jgi:phage/plasmid-like protein (TIGR03299 family)
MPAEVESMFSRREIPWHGLGVIVPEDITETDKVLELAHLADWDVHFENARDLFSNDYSMDEEFLFTVRHNPFYEEARKDEANYKMTPYNVLGRVKSRYNILQNEELAEFAELLLEGARWETAGSLRGGKVVFMAMALETETTIDESGVNEQINNYLVVKNSHDGSSALTAMVTNIRPVCMNTLDWGYKKASQRFNISHTKSMEERMRAAKQTLNLATKYNTVFKEDAEFLLNKKATDDDFIGLIGMAYPMPDRENKGGMTRWLGRVENLERIWVSDTVQGAGIKNTAWGVLQTLTEDAQWTRQVKEGKIENFWSAGSGFEKNDQVQRQQFHNIVSQFATL